MFTFPAIHSANSIVVDTNVIVNLLKSDPTGSSLNLLVLDGSTTYITDTVEAEVRNNVSGELFYIYLAWAYSNHSIGEVELVPTGIPADRNQGEYSMLWAVENGFAGNGPYLMLSGDGDARDSFGGLDTANTMELANSLLLSGEVSLARYYILAAQIAVVAPHEVIGPDGANLAFVPGFRGMVNGVEVIVGTHGLTINGQIVGLLQTFEIDPRTGAVTVDGPENCFGSGTPIDMWPYDQSTKSNPDGMLDKNSGRDKIWRKPIEMIRVGDTIVSYDASGTLIAGTVSKIFHKKAAYLLDVSGLMVTPGHVTLCGDGLLAGKHVPIIDILRSDGALVRQDGSLVRAATGVPVGEANDRLIWVVTGTDTTEGFCIREAKQIRLGTRFILQSGKDFSIAELIAANGGEVTEDGLVATGGKDPAPFHWSFSPKLPNPEDYVLQRSCVTLEDIYHAAEWETVAPVLASPLLPIVDSRRAEDVRPRKAIRPNVPLALREEHRTGEIGSRSFTPVASAKHKHVH